MASHYDSWQEKIAQRDKQEEDEEEEEMHALREKEKKLRDQNWEELNKIRVANGEKPLPLYRGESKSVPNRKPITKEILNRLRNGPLMGDMGLSARRDKNIFLKDDEDDLYTEQQMKDREAKIDQEIAEFNRRNEASWNYRQKMGSLGGRRVNKRSCKKRSCKKRSCKKHNYKKRNYKKRSCKK
jgi:hypothetical protein